MSEPGDTAAETIAAASRRAASSTTLPTSDSSAAGIRAGASPTANIVIRASWQIPSASFLSIATAPTRAKSPSRRLTSLKPQRQPSPFSVGRRISVSKCSGSSEVINGPMANSLAAMVCVPPLPATTNSAFSAVQIAGSSAAGSAWARLPPMVPRLRIWKCPMWEMAAVIIGKAPRMMSERCRSRCLARAPTVIVPAEAEIPERPSILLMSTTTAGRTSRRFIIGIRLCPPASTLASGPCCARSSMASSRVFGAK